MLVLVGSTYEEAVARIDVTTIVLIYTNNCCR